MLTRVREGEAGGYVVTVLDANGIIETRDEPSLEKAFAMQRAIQDAGKWPDGKEPGK